MDDADRQQTSHLGTIILAEDSAKVHIFLVFFLAFDIPNCAAGVLYFFLMLAQYLSHAGK